MVRVMPGQTLGEHLHGSVVASIAAVVVVVVVVQVLPTTTKSMVHAILQNSYNLRHLLGRDYIDIDKHAHIKSLNYIKQKMEIVWKFFCHLTSQKPPCQQYMQK